MIKRGFIAAFVAALLLAQMPAAAENNDNGNGDERRDGQSRYEVAPYSYLPLLLVTHERLRIAMIVMMMQNLTYNLLTAQGVDVTSQNRVGLGGLFGGIFAKTYSADDFVKSLEVGSVYRAGDDKIVVALKGERRLEDYRIIVFNGDNQYDPRARPALQQVAPATLAVLGTIPLVTRMLLHSITPQAAQLAADPEQDPQSLSDVGVDVMADIPRLRALLIGKVYIGSNNTLLVVIPPAIVQREG